MFEVLGFYKFTKLKSLKKNKVLLQDFLIKKEIRGTIIIANLNTWHAGAKNISGKSRKTIFLQIKKRNEPALLNYKKFLSEKTKNTLSEAQKYLLSIREIDFTQKEDSVGPGDMYRKIYGKDRGAIQKR